MSKTVRQSEKARAQAREQGRVLLVTEDGAVARQAAELEAAGLFVAVSEGGTTALIAIQRTRPHVVVADSRLRGISAQEFLRIIQVVPYGQ